LARAVKTGPSGCRPPLRVGWGDDDIWRPVLGRPVLPAPFPARRGQGAKVPVCIKLGICCPYGRCPRPAFYARFSHKNIPVEMTNSDFNIFLRKFVHIKPGRYVRRGLWKQRTVGSRRGHTGRRRWAGGQILSDIPPLPVRGVSPFLLTNWSKYLGWSAATPEGGQPSSGAPPPVATAPP